MLIQCPNCAKKYKIDPEKVPEKGARLNCPGCGHSFAIRKKKEAVPAPRKTPPCEICGAPSTRVLQAERPMVLCETCFEREKEKTRRLFTPPSPEETPETQKKEPPLKKEPLPPVPPASESPIPPEMEFDSFAEIPDLDIDQEGITDTETKGSEKSETSLIEEMQKFKKIEEPVFEDTEFEPPPEIKTKPQVKEPSPSPVPPPESSSTPLKAEEEGGDEFVFSPKEVERMEDIYIKTGAEKEIFEPQAKRQQSPPFQDQNYALEREIFGELAEEKKPEIIEKPVLVFPKKARYKLPRISSRTAILAGIIILVLIAGYFAFSRDFFRPLLSSSGSKQQEKVLTEEDQRIFQEHLRLAQELYRKDTEKSYLEALAEIRLALKIDSSSSSAHTLNLLVASLLAQRSPSFINFSRAKALAKRMEPEIMLKPEAQAGKALIYLAENNYPSALVIAEKLEKEYPEYALGYWIHALVHLKSKVPDPEQAEILLKKSIELDPKLVQAIILLAELNFQKKQYQTALEQIQEVLKLSPQHPEANTRFKELQNLITQAKVSEEKPGSGLLLAQPPVPSQAETPAPPAVPLPIKPEPKPGGTITPTSPASQPAKADLNQELQNYLLNIISETRPVLSRTHTLAPSTPTAPSPNPPPASAPPEEAPPSPPPSRPPEEAP